MTTLERIRGLDDNELISIYNGFSRKLLADLAIDPVEILTNPPGELYNTEEFQKVNTGDLDDLETAIVPEEVIPSLRLVVEEWANNPEVSPALDAFLDEPRDTEMAAGVILAVGAVIVATIVASSIKAEIIDGKVRFTYDSKGAKNTVDLVKALLTGIPETLKSLV